VDIEMREPIQNPKIVGFVHLRVGGDLVAVPVQAVPLERDQDGRASGGFFMDSEGKCGILVDSALPASEAKRQLDQAIADAASQLSKRFLN
jgi:hypothetical protein